MVLSIRPALFQSRCGFSGCLDSHACVGATLQIYVSIPLWVFWLSRLVLSRAGGNISSVSIPLWVFWLSRHQNKARPAEYCCGFNPVVGFLAVSTSISSGVGQQKIVSIPLWVFWLSRLSDGSHIESWPRSFQSRCGFSGCLDSTPRSTREYVKSCFNPVVGFLAVSTVFGPRCSDSDERFQSRCGFSGCLDSRWRNRRGRPRAVSIPLWVFWLSRPRESSL